MPSRLGTLRSSLLEGRRLLGLFSRLKDPHAVETLGASRLDFLVLDVEHGSLGRDDIDQIVFAGLSGDLPVWVRVPDAAPAGIQHAISVGASGVIVPHITSAAEAQAVANFARTSAVERAYAGMGRLSEHRDRPWSEFQAHLREHLVVIAQIDEPAGVAAADGIAKAAGIDAVFMGTLSIALALGSDQARAVDEAMARICDACRAAGRRVGMHLRDHQAQPTWSRRGVNFYVVGNDRSLLLDGAEQALARFSA